MNAQWNRIERTMLNIRSSAKRDIPNASEQMISTRITPHKVKPVRLILEKAIATIGLSLLMMTLVMCSPPVEHSLSATELPLKITNVPNESIGTSNTQITPYPTDHSLPNIPLMEEITCSLNLENVTAIPGITDEIIPGITTQNDVVTLLGSPSIETIWEGRTHWVFDAFDVYVLIEEGRVIERNAPWYRLDEIVVRYGPPEQVVWRVPKSAYHGAMYNTYLLYPTKGTMFISGSGELVSNFTNDELFGSSYVAEHDRYNQIVEAEEIFTDEFDEAIVFDWPCAN